MLVKMNLDRFNLNLFVAFEALSKADTLTQAAGALYVTQSTLSVALRQMREYFDDELFVYKPKQKELTPLAQNLRPRVLEILKTAKATLMLKEETARFDRTTCLAVVPDDSLLLANAKSQSHVQYRALKSGLLAGLD
jgi:DNA-binding transcriptional LysR family regulator